MATQVSTQRLLKQLRALRESPLEDIALIEIDDDSIHEVHAYIFGPADTPYEGGVFKMKLVYGSDYPSAPPKGYFQTKLFHPNVSAKGDICVNTLKRDWKPDVTVSHILMIIKCLLINPGPDSALNEEAGRLLMEDYASFAKHARLITGIHAVKPIAAISELGEANLPSISFSVGLTGILGERETNASRSEGRDLVDIGPDPKKLKVATDKKKAEARKKTLKRL